MNRVIKARDLDAIYIIGPGHGGPAIVANAYLEGTYSEVYPSITRDTEGIRKLFRQFSFPGGIPSHVAPETPGSIHEGGELGYALTHAYGAAFDNPDLVVCAVVGDGEAETGPLATSWHSNKFLNPVTDGAVLPILHLNGYKIANPTVLARIPREELTALMEGYGHTPYYVVGDDPADVHQQLAATLDRALDDIREIQRQAREERRHGAAALADDRVPDAEGLDGPEGDRRPPGRGHLAQPPGADERGPHQRGQPRDPRALDALVPARGAVRRRGPAPPRAGRAAADRHPPDERQPRRQRRRAPARAAAARLPRLRRGRPVTRRDDRGGDAGARHLRARRDGPQHRQLPDVRAGRDRVQPPRLRARGDRPHLDGRDRPGRRPPRPGRPRHGGALGAPVPGLARGLPAHRAPRHLQLLRGVHPHRRLDVQPAREVAEGDPRHAVAAADRVAQLHPVVARLAPGPQRVQPPGPRLHRPRRQQEVGRDPGLPAARREHAALGRRPLPPVAATT